MLARWAALMLLFTKASAANIVKTKTCQAGLTAVIGILGLAWLGDTFILDNKEIDHRGADDDGDGNIRACLFSVGLFVKCVDAAVQ